MNYIDNDYEGETSLQERRQSERHCIDLQHLFVFGMFFTLWIGIAFYAFTAGHRVSDYITDEDFDRVVNVLSTNLYKCSGVCAAFIWLAILFLALYFIVIRFLTKYVIYATIILQFMLLSALFVFALLLDFVLLKALLLTILSICFIIYGFSIYVIRKVGCNIVSTVILDSLKAIKCHPISIVIVIIYAAFMSLVVYITDAVIFGLLTIPKVRISVNGFDVPKLGGEGPPNYVYILLFAFASCSLWILILICNIGRTILYGIFSTWYRTADKTRIPRTISLRITYATLRYHMGTLTFGSTIFTIVQIIRAIYNSWIDLYGQFRTKKITIFCFLVVLANATTNTFVVCVTYGTGYYRSLRDSFKLLMQNPLKFAATRLVTEWMIVFGVVLIPGLTILFAYMYLVPYAAYYQASFSIAIFAIAIVSSVITGIALETFYAATTAILLCFLQDLSLNQRENVYDEDDDIVTEST